MVGCREPHIATHNERQSHDRLNGRAVALSAVTAYMRIERIGFLILPLI